MTTGVNQFSPIELIDRLECNLQGWLPVFGKLGRVSDNEPPGVTRSIVDIPFAFFNSVIGTHLEPGQENNAIQIILADAKARKMPILWWLTPSSQPANLGDQLEARGFIKDDDGPGMVVNLEELNDHFELLPGLSIRRTENPDEWRQWAKTVELGFEVPELSDLRIKGWQDLLSMVDQNTVRAYLGWLDGKPVSTSLVLFAGDMAGIYAVATIPEARRKGIGARVTLQPLLEAREMGYRVGGLQASEMGQPVYRSLGFKEYCWIRSFVFRP